MSGLAPFLFYFILGMSCKNAFDSPLGKSRCNIYFLTNRTSLYTVRYFGEGEKDKVRQPKKKLNRAIDDV
jgi:hypothetical protein